MGVQIATQRLDQARKRRVVTATSLVQIGLLGNHIAHERRFCSMTGVPPA
jgi:hypothetical protein